MQLSPAVIRAWERHFDHFPPGDRYAQMLLANLSIMFQGANKSKEQPGLNMMQVAPWLLTREERDDIEEQDEQIRQALQASMAADILKRKQKENRS